MTAPIPEGRPRVTVRGIMTTVGLVGAFIPAVAVLIALATRSA